MDNKIEECVNVSLRIRPVISQDSTTSSCLHVISKRPPVLLVLDRSQTYCFDNIFTEEVDQATVYNETVKPLVEYVKSGYSCTVFAYGQTGTGKTYTMGTSTRVESEKDGLIPRAIDQCFAHYDEDAEISISVSFIEIYNEKVFDLLQNDNPPLIVKGFKVQGFNEEKIFNCHEAKRFLEMGNRNRHTAGTKQNSNSSRSHAIFTIYCNVRYQDRETTAKLNLVDLAGCESVKKTGNQGSTFQEGININKGLLCIGQVMTALSTNSSFIPYRQSIITTILQDSLNKKNFVSLIACVNSSPEDCNETIQTLEFAHRVKKLKNKPEVNELLTHYRKENPTLFQCMKISNTPFKRPTAFYQTPCPPKRAKDLPLRNTKEPSLLSGNNTTVDSPKSLLSMSVSSISSNVNITQQTLSPVIKKYMNAMESSLMDRLETVIKNTLTRPTRSSLLMKEVGKENKENTPSMSWNKIQNEVSKIVRNEIAQLTAKATRAASSPIDDHHDFDKIRRVLNYENLASNEQIEDDQNFVINNKSGFEVNSDFKIPEIPVTKKKNLRTKRTPSISPIEYVPTRPRKSARLSLKRIDDNNSLDISSISLESSFLKTKKNINENRKCTFKGDHTNESQYDEEKCSFRLDETGINIRVSSESSCNDIEDFGQSNSNSFRDDKASSNEYKTHYAKRCSIRLTKKIIDLQDSKNNRNGTNLNKLKPNTIKDGDSLEESYPNDTEIDTDKKNNKYFTHSSTRRSIRLTHKDKDLQGSRKKSTLVVNKRRTSLTVKDSPVGKRLFKYDTVKDSPATSHTKHVLDVLNNGNLRQLEKLHSIGQKTAQQILLFREINGPMKKISSLSKMPGWQGKKFEKFGVGKLSTKSKVIYTIRPKSQVFRKKIKQERASTPQRWSRRIRSLPPIPINVLAPHRKTRKKSTNYKKEKFGLSKLVAEKEKTNSSRIRKGRRNDVFINKNVSHDKLNTVEVVRIVPVVVYVKKPSKANLRSTPEEIRVHINGRSTCKMFTQALDSHVRTEIKQEHTSLERRFSRRLSMLPPTSYRAVTPRRKCASKKNCVKLNDI
ncbi:hypothetical protein NQ314_019784 [Rhamnusium bicolor]|uniref:Kinesin motor domain-containing protein n=1 Tax=Rhamnusium bicolor TaxID=1586634 RepID=A0AAV8WMZ5_9CUCU|nr:hypothetical protein NQ314_019784 [Rhamnusium bicolor]